MEKLEKIKKQDNMKRVPAVVGVGGGGGGGTLEWEIYVMGGRSERRLHPQLVGFVFISTMSASIISFTSSCTGTHEAISQLWRWKKLQKSIRQNKTSRSGNTGVKILFSLWRWTRNQPLLTQLDPSIKLILYYGGILINYYHYWTLSKRSKFIFSKD